MCALMVNADDWGASVAATDAIARCFDAGAVTAASAMVHMRDSLRAAQLARQRGLPVGLHLNLSQPFDGPDVPPAERARQAAVTRRFAHLRLRRWLYDPRGRHQVDHAIADQLAEFERLYGTPPRRLDGHLHVHVCPNVLLSPALPRDVWLRSVRTRALQEGGPLLAPLRRLRERWLRQRFATSAWFFSIEDVHPQLGGHGLEQVLELAREQDVEVMTHPARPREQALLLSAQWAGSLRGTPLAAFPAPAGERS